MTAEPLRVWIDAVPSVDFADRAARLGLNPLLRAQRDPRLDPSQRALRYGSMATDYVLTDRAEAEVAALPLVHERLDRREISSRLAQAERAGLKTLVFAGGDIEPILPSASMILLHPGPTRGAQPHAHSLALPYLLTDRAQWPEPRPDGDRPSVAFCGQGAARPFAEGWHRARRTASALANRVRPRRVTPPVQGHVGLRGEALRLLATDDRVDDHFVIRDQYRAGTTSEAGRARTQVDFDDNLRSATYALCIRGTGNFSARFYEALSFGRVPLFVDTDCILPFENEIDWPSRTVWVDQSNISTIGYRLSCAHEAVMDDPARSADALRGLWQDRLTQDGYFRHLVPVLRALL